MKNLFKLGLALLVSITVLGVQNAQAYDGPSYYKNISFTVKNPEPAKGKVFVIPYNLSDTASCNISKDPKEGSVKGYLSNNGNDFKAYVFAMPEKGYVLDCLTTPEGYRSGKYRENAFIYNDEGYAIVGGELTLANDTTVSCVKSRPAKKNDYAPYPYVGEFYSVFVPAKQMTVTTKVAGSVEKAVKAGKYGEKVNELTVIGPVNAADLEYLNKLSQEKGLIRLDLIDAKINVIPDRTFYKTALYEIKLPKTLQAVGESAFAYSPNLAPIKLPEGIVKGSSIFSNCPLINYYEKIKEKPSSSLGWLDPFFWLY